MIPQHLKKPFMIGTAAALGLTFFFREDIGAIALPSSPAAVDDLVLLTRLDLPRTLPDGSVLRTVERDADRVTYRHEMTSAAPTRDAYRQIVDDRCAEWRGHLRSGTVSVVETRYEGVGRTSVFYLQRGQCG